MNHSSLQLKKKFQSIFLLGTTILLLFASLLFSFTYTTPAQAALCIPKITNFKVTPVAIPTKDDRVTATYTVTTEGCQIADAQKWKSSAIVFTTTGEDLKYGLSHDLTASMFKKSGTTYSVSLSWSGKIFQKNDAPISQNSINLRPRMYQGAVHQAEDTSSQVLIKIDPKAVSPAGTTTGGTKTPAPTVVKNPTNLDKSTSEGIDESGGSGFVFCGNTVDTPCNITHLFRTLIVIINYLISMVGLVAILFIVISGIQMIISQGAIPGKEGDQTSLTKAKKRLSGAVTGIVLVAIAFVLVNSLFAGSLNIGIRNGALILSNPKAYINECEPDQDCTLPSEANPNPKPVTQTQGTPEKKPATSGN